MLLFVIIFSILAGVILTLVSTQTRLMEEHIRRVKGYYVAESGAVAAIDSLRRGVAVSNPAVEWLYDPVAGTTYRLKTPSVTNETGAGIAMTTRINSSFDYSTGW